MPSSESRLIASGHDSGFITKPSRASVADTAARVSRAAQAKGMKVFAVVDHSGEARASGLSLRDTMVVIFGSPKGGTPAMQSEPLTALDLPLKVLVWADGEQTKLTYTAPAELAARFRLDAEHAGKLAAIDAVTDAALAG
ncbi:MAG TPA: DUF302 domain-containing protein [Solirubrobacteraceae bacterium]|jgi:uncharacterized protein (DUF302 family)|nr:DUF302 domain-containing protein [Solirubrobacteraceae bacterium]